MFKVQKTHCDQCLFTPQRIVTRARAREIVADCLAKDTFFNCHKTQLEGSDEQVCCAGYWAKYKDQFNMGRIAQRLGAVVKVLVTGKGNAK